MLTEEQQHLWNAYLGQEKAGPRPLLTESLERFVVCVEATPSDQWSDWALSVCQQIVHEGKGIPVRFPLFRRVLFPALLAGYHTQLPGCARWLASLHTHLHQIAGSREQLGVETLGQVALLKVALVHDPDDTASRRKLISVLADGLEYTLHELPASVLHDHQGASVEECLELEEELEEFNQLVGVAGMKERYRKLVDDCQTHYAAYRGYLHRRSEFHSYAEYLQHHDIEY